MPNYYYKAVTSDGVEDEGEMTEVSAAAVIRRLQESGSIPILAEEIVSGRLKPSTFRISSLKRKAPPPDITSFTRSLALLLASGTALDRAMDIMLAVEDNPASCKLVQDIQASVRGGAALSSALEEQDNIFSGFYVSMIRGAEISGTLSEGLERMLEYLERSRALREKIVSALIYPAILLLVAGLSVIILLTLVVPQFRPIFEEMGSALPLATRMVLAVSDFFASYWWLSMLTIVAAVVGAKQFLTIPQKRFQLDELLLRRSLIGPLIRAHETARFTRSLGTLLHSGVPILQSLEIARETLSNRAMAASVAEAAMSLKEGGELSDTLLEASVFPGLAIQMIKVGEETGNLDSMMLRIAEVYDDEVAIKVQRMLAMLEPLMIVGLGVIIAGIIMSILIGIISINDLPI
jgi:general secretion pathway protein F